ncbi:MAG: SH3 domain-containing protein [Armatimonadetes bacterium]|nr:SH3 domain-containing protein [Anaerolineae bacterium]
MRQPVDVLFSLVGISFAVLYAIVMLVRTVLRRTTITFIELLLAFMTALVLLAGLIVSSEDGVSGTLIEVVALGTAGALAVLGVLLLIIELFRPQRLKQSRGILTLGMGVLLAITSLGVPLAGAYFSLPPRDAQAPSVAANTTAGMNPTEAANAEFFAVFTEVMQVISDATGLTTDEVLAALDNGQTVAQLVEVNNGDIEQVIDDITGLMQDFVRQLVSENRIDRLRGATGIAGMEIAVRYAVNNDLLTLVNAGQGEQGGTPVATAGEGTPRQSFFSFLTATFTPEVGDGTTIVALPSVTATQTAPPTITPPPSAAPPATRTPRPSPTATQTRALYVTRTPTITATLPSPCIAIMDFNVNLREQPALDAPLLATIPFETALNVFGRNADTTWWYVEYQGLGGWVKAEFVTTTSSCPLLPVQR